MRALRVALVVVVFAFSACSLIVDTHCFEGECDGSIDATSEAAADVVVTDITTTDVDPCAFAADADPCANVPDGYGGCYCGTSVQTGFDPGHASPSCLYRCVDNVPVPHTDKTHYCAAGCTVADSGTADFCNGEPCDGGSVYCNVYCGGP